MRTLGQLAALAAAFLLVLAAPAFADHMNGRYVGAGMSAGTVLNLTQQGTTISGDFSGALNGTFQGQTDGGDFAEGYLTESNTNYPYYLNWSAEQLVITIYDTMGNQMSYVFAPEGGQAPITSTTQTHEPDEMQFAELSFFVYLDGIQSGPFTLDETIGKIQSGEISGDTLVWLAGTPDWVPAANINLLAEALPPSLPPAASYYLALNGQQIGPLSLDDVITMINEGDLAAEDLVWTDGMEAWQRASTFAEFAEALIPVPEVPPPPPPTTQPDNPPPPPTNPDTPPPPTTGDGSPLSMEEFSKVIDAVMAHYGPNAGPTEQAMSTSCLFDSVSALSPTEQRELLASGGVPSAAIMAAHPDFDSRAGNCIATPNGNDTSTTTPPTTTNPPNSGDDSFVTAVREYVKRLGVGGAEEAVITCMLSGYSVLTPEERQILADSDLMPSPSQMRAIETAHPEMAENMQDCFDAQVN